MAVAFLLDRRNYGARTCGSTSKNAVPPFWHQLYEKKRSHRKVPFSPFRFVSYFWEPEVNLTAVQSRYGVKFTDFGMAPFAAAPIVYVGHGRG